MPGRVHRARHVIPAHRRAANGAAPEAKFAAMTIVALVPSAVAVRVAVEVLAVVPDKTAVVVAVAVTYVAMACAVVQGKPVVMAKYAAVQAKNVARMRITLIAAVLMKPAVKELVVNAYKILIVPSVGVASVACAGVLNSVVVKVLVHHTFL